MSTSLNCPRCTSGFPLLRRLTKQAVEVDECPECRGIWLDRGELFHFAAKPRDLILEFKRARTAATASSLRSPRGGGAMQQLVLFDGIAIDQCVQSEGVWLDGGELQQVMKKSAGALRAEMAEPQPGAAREEAVSPERLAAYAGGLMGLPNLVTRSILLLGGLYALLGALLIVAVEFGGLSPDFALLAGVVVAVLQFVFGPWMMDLSLRWFYHCSWQDERVLPEHLRAFVTRVCAQHDLRFPRIGIIEDGSPNAFTYGHHPGNARIVFTRGLFDLLDEGELEAVVAHELGHAVHWDMLVMTAAALVPLIAYYVYRTLIKIKVKGRDKSAGARLAIALSAYLVYVVSQYLVLWLSRTREYHADAFAAEATGDPGLLARALVKIGYGLAGREDGARKGRTAGQERRPTVEAIGTLGIFDARAARALAVASPSTGGLEPDQVKGAMRWDLWNPWAKWYEVHSTHPLIAHRLDRLGRLSAAVGKAPLIVFDEVQPESYWDEFAVDLVVLALPWIGAIAGGALFLATAQARFFGIGVAAFGIGLLVRTLITYRADAFPDMSVAALLKNVKVSGVRGIPCTLRGTIIGRGVPGLIWSEDFVLRDDTGILFMDYRQPIRLFEFLFGLLRAGAYQNTEVDVTGWYRRAPVPYLELHTLGLRGCGYGKTCYTKIATIVGAILLVALGLWLATVMV